MGGPETTRPARRFRGRFAKPFDYTGFGGPAESLDPAVRRRKAAGESASCGARLHVPGRARTAARRARQPLYFRACSASSGSSSRRPARCASPRCSSSSRCARTCCRARTGRFEQRHRHAGGRHVRRRRRGWRATRTPRRRRCPRSSTSTPARKCARAIRSLDDPLFRRYFPDLADGAARAADEPGLGRHRVARGLRAHQPPRDRGRRRHPARARRRAPRVGARARHRSRIRPRRAEGGRRRPAGDHVRQLGRRAGRRRRARDRQSVRLRQHGDARDRERARPQLPRRQPLRGFHPDRRRDQPRQLGRRARRHRRQPDRHQQHDLLAVGRLARHRRSRSPCRSRATCSSRSSRTAR